MTDWGRDWFTLSIAREIMQPLMALAEFWQVSPENAISLLIRAVEQQVWPAGDVAHDPVAYQEWATQIVATDPRLNPHLPTEHDRVSLRALGYSDEEIKELPHGRPLGRGPGPGGEKPR